MSSFAHGNLLLKEHFEVVKEHMADDSFIIELGNKWVAYLTKNDLGPSDNIAATNFSFEILLISKKAPVLYFNHPEDHGWGFGILENGKIVSAMKIDYDDYIDFGPDFLGPKQAAQMFMAHLTGGDPEKFLVRQPAPDPSDVFSRVDFEKFRLFSLDDNQVGELRKCLSPESLCDDRQRYEMVDTFKRVLDFEMDFISWEKVSDYGNEYFTILAKR